MSRQPDVAHYRRAIFGAERELAGVRAELARESAREIRIPARISRLESAEKGIVAQIAEWRRAMSALIDAKAAATATTRANRLRRAEEKRARKAKRRLAHTHTLEKSA